MIDIKDKTYKPSIQEIKDFIENPLFLELYEYMNSEYSALHSVEYSADSLLMGRNVRFYKAGARF